MVTSVGFRSLSLTLSLALNIALEPRAHAAFSCNEAITELLGEKTPGNVPAVCPAQAKRVELDKIPYPQLFRIFSLHDALHNVRMTDALEAQIRAYLMAAEGQKVTVNGVELTATGAQFSEPEARFIISRYPVRVQDYVAGLLGDFANDVPKRTMILRSFSGNTYSGIFIRIDVADGHAERFVLRDPSGTREVPYLISRLDWRNTRFGSLAQFKQLPKLFALEPFTPYEFLPTAVAGQERAEFGIVGHILGLSEGGNRVLILPHNAEYTRDNVLQIPLSAFDYDAIQPVVPNECRSAACTVPAKDAEVRVIMAHWQRELGNSLRRYLLPPQVATFLGIDLTDPLFERGYLPVSGDATSPSKAMLELAELFVVNQPLAVHVRGTGITLLHGSTSPTLLAAKLGSAGLVPSGQLLQDPTAMPPYGGENLWGLAGMNRTNLSTVFLDAMTEAISYSLYHSYCRNKSGCGWNPTKGQALLDKIAADPTSLPVNPKTVAVIKALEERRIAFWPSIAAADRPFVEDAFPVVFGIATAPLGLGRIKPAPSDIFHEVQVEGTIPWPAIRRMFVPRDRIQVVLDLMKAAPAWAGLTDAQRADLVRPIEDLLQLPKAPDGRFAWFWRLFK